MNLDLFKIKVKEIRPMLIKTARRFMNDEDDVEDVVQDVLLRLCELKDEQIDNLEGLAKVLVRHVCVNRLRLRHEKMRIDDFDLCFVAPDMNPEGLSDEEERIMLMIRCLPTVQQTVLRLRHVEDMDMNDIANLIGASEQSVRQMLSRARRYIREQYLTKNKGL